MKALRNQITFIAQKPCLFPGSIKDNLTENLSTGDSTSHLSKILDIFYDINFLRCREFEGTKQEVFQQILGLNVDNSLSHGERQILCILKLMHKPNKLVIFDEPTSNIDSKTTETLVEIMVGSKCFDKSSTVLMIAHQLKTLYSCDRIFKMSDGRMVEVKGEELEQIKALGKP